MTAFEPGPPRGKHVAVRTRRSLTYSDARLGNLDTKTRWFCVLRKKVITLSRKPTPLVPWPLTSGTQDHEKTTFHCEDRLGRLSDRRTVSVNHARPHSCFQPVCSHICFSSLGSQHENTHLPTLKPCVAHGISTSR